MLLGSMSPLTVMASPQFHAAQLPKVVASLRQVVWTFIDTASPAVFTHDIAKTGVGRLWRLKTLENAFQDESVTVSVSQGRAFRSQGGSEILGRRMAFADFATYVENSNRKISERLYLSQFPVDTTPAILGSDVATPSYIPDGSSPVSKNLWFGPVGTISPLHFDRNHNLLHQHWGRKHVVMVASAVCWHSLFSIHPATSPHTLFVEKVCCPDAYKNYIKTHMYYPQLHVDAELEWIQIRKQLLRLLSSEELAKKLIPSTEDLAKKLGTNQVPGTLLVAEDGARPNKGAWF
jgi:hypothetical protein